MGFSLTLALIVAVPSGAVAQRLEIAPFGGFRVGGGLFDTAAGMPVDLTVGPAFGAVADLFLGGDQSVLFLYSRQQTNADVAGVDGPVRGALVVEHYHVGGAEELGTGVVRPLVEASLGLTRLGAPSSSEVRFSFGGGGGVKMMPWRHIGARFDGRVYGVVVNGTVFVGCVSGLCSTRVNAYVSWQLELTAGAVIAF